ncbi:protease complex subunit PrcB family protein [Alkaliphilus crotonatoxidans]
MNAERNQLNQDVSYKIYKVENGKLKVEVYWDKKPCAGYKIQIQDVEVKDKEIKVYYKKVYPDMDEIYCQVIKTPKASYEVAVEAIQGENIQEEYKITLIDS